MSKLKQLQHHNRQPFCQIYGAHKLAPGMSATRLGEARECFQGAVDQGPTVACNFLGPDGSFIGYRSVQFLRKNLEVEIL